MEFKKYRKCLIPAVADALIVNANINKGSGGRKSFATRTEANFACESYVAKLQNKRHSETSYIGLGPFCLESRESRHFYSIEPKIYMENFGDMYIDKNVKKCRRREEKLSTKFEKMGNVFRKHTLCRSWDW